MKHRQSINRSFFKKVLSRVLAGVLLLEICRTHGVTVSYSDLNPPGATSSGAYGVSGAQQVGYAMVAGQMHAAVWNGTANSFVDLHPSGASYSIARAVGGQSQVGIFGTGSSHAALWSGTSDSMIDLNPDFAASDALGVSNGQQVGNVSFGNPPQAVLWSGTASSYIILHPAGADASYANGVNGQQQVGYVSLGNDAHAVTWSGSSNSCVDLHPKGALRSEGYATTGSQQVGIVWTQEGSPHAGLWSGSADSFIDLNPEGAVASYAYGVCGTQQAGHAQIGVHNNAALCASSSESFLNLHLALGTNYTDSQATGINITAALTQVVGYAATTAGNTHAILWTISRPPTLALSSIQPVGSTNILTLKWTNSPPGYALESTPNLSAAWSDAPASLATNGTEVTATLTNHAWQQFFRLRGL